MSDAEQGISLSTVMARLDVLAREHEERGVEIAQLRARLAWSAADRAVPQGSDDGSAQAGASGTSRRRLLQLALGTLAVTAGVEALPGTQPDTALADTPFSSNGATGGQAAVIATGVNGANAVNAASDSGAGLKASSTTGPAVTANSVTGTGLSASSDGGAGIMTSSAGGPALHAVAGPPQSGTTGVRAAVVADAGSALVGVGVVGASGLGRGSGVVGVSQQGYGVVAQGGLAPLYLKPSATTGAPTTGPHLQGELYADSTGALFYCVTSGTPGAWKQVMLM